MNILRTSYIWGHVLVIIYHCTFKILLKGKYSHFIGQKTGPEKQSESISSLRKLVKKIELKSMVSNTLFFASFLQSIVKYYDWSLVLMLVYLVKAKHEWNYLWYFLKLSVKYSMVLCAQPCRSIYQSVC